MAFLQTNGLGYAKDPHIREQQQEKAEEEAARWLRLFHKTGDKDLVAADDRDDRNDAHDSDEPDDSDDAFDSDEAGDSDNDTSDANDNEDYSDKKNPDILQGLDVLNEIDGPTLEGHEKEITGPGKSDGTVKHVSPWACLAVLAQFFAEALVGDVDVAGFAHGEESSRADNALLSASSDEDLAHRTCAMSKNWSPTTDDRPALLMESKSLHLRVSMLDDPHRDSWSPPHSPFGYYSFGVAPTKHQRKNCTLFLVTCLARPDQVAVLPAQYFYSNKVYHRTIKPKPKSSGSRLFFGQQTTFLVPVDRPISV